MTAVQDKIVLITGGAKGIGAQMTTTFREAGARVYTMDLTAPADFIGDLAKQADLEAFANFVLEKHSGIDVLIHNAAPLMKGISSASYEDFTYALQVGVAAPFYLTKLFKDHLNPGASILMLSSSRDRMSQPETETYTAAKGGIAALTHALAVSLAGKARVNSISPGWIDTAGEEQTLTDHMQHPAGRIGRPEDIANLALFLSSEQAGFITGENITVDGGMTRLMIYHDDQGWTYQKD
ncbi:SDR family oxidoreductase [Streptococcus moroccensis]|uniref:NAD(P)-dependent dehydrogenase (Short-subunit alcohol dehydrogenase family) n=1 Tax=Streptococcus moroccensis TaxID=1451356 RepID=A0ABT9YS40_9STRE|nr:SDR family oxidoreductase [Streptococcus moroccensis]MDQ0222807.1 NAD(P)-dependent dehydrogenase (short-subunit alcohol dehydrogenase family) [Streptococcus moroccensis]